MSTVLDKFDILEQSMPNVTALEPQFEEFADLMSTYIQRKNVIATVGVICNNKLTYHVGEVRYTTGENRVIVNSNDVYFHADASFRVVRYKTSVQFIAEKGNVHFDLTLYIM